MDQDGEAWVIPIPSTGVPQFAVLPWRLYQELLRRSGTEIDPPATDPQLPDNVRRLPLDNRAGRRPGAVEGGEMPPRFDIWGKAEAEASADFADFGEPAGDDQIPLDVLERLLEGEHPVKVFRKHRGLTQKELADRTGLNATYLSQIETRKRGGSTRVYRRLAAALSVDIGHLID